MGGSDIASSCSVLRSRRPQTRLEASCTRTGRPRRRLLPTSSRTAGEGLGRKARMNVPEESDSGVLPMNHSNEVEQSMAESEEGRPLIKGNIHQSSTRPTQSGARVSQGLAGVRKAAREHKERKFTALLHHVTVAARGSGQPAVRAKNLRLRRQRARQVLQDGRRNARSSGGDRRRRKVLSVDRRSAAGDVSAIPTIAHQPDMPGGALQTRSATAGGRHQEYTAGPGFRAAP